jgi:transketolase
MQMRDHLINKIFKYAYKKKEVILISNEQGAQSLDKFRLELPNQFINAGISEQNIISVAAGLAKQKKKIYVYSIASFITLRCFEQIKIDLNIMNLPVTIFGVGASYSYDTSGPTHHSIEDISILRTMKNLEIFSPSDNNILGHIFDYSTVSKKPAYIRLDRKPLDILQRNTLNFKNGFSTTGNLNSKRFIVSTGNMSHMALEALKICEENYNISICLIDIFSIRFQKKNFLKIIKNAKLVLTLEEHVLEGGLGSIISEILFDYRFNKKLDLIRMGIDVNKLYTYKSRNLIHKYNKIEVKDIVNSILSSLIKK